MKLYDLNEFPNFPFKNWEDIRDIAIDVLIKHYGSDIPIPIPIEEILEFKEKIHLQVSGLGGHLLGDSDINNRVIRINHSLLEEKMYGRLRFTFAHEYAHFILHSPYFQGVSSFHDDAYDFYHKNCVILERQADYFAGCFLMPPILAFKKWEELTGVQLSVLDNRFEKKHNSELETLIDKTCRETGHRFSCIYYDHYKEHSPKNHRLISDLASTFNISFESCRVNIRKMGLPLWIH